MESGSTLNGNINAQQADSGNVNVGAAGTGTATITGNIGASNLSIHNFGLANGATLAFGGTSQLYIANLSLFSGGGALNAGTYKIDIYHDDAHLRTTPEGSTQTLYLKTTVNSLTGQHGYFAFSQTSTYGGAGARTLLNSGTPVIIPVVVGSVTQGSRYVIIQDTDGTAGFSTPTVSNSGGYRWTVSSVTGTGQTDTDGVSYGNGYTNIVITNAGSNAAGTATGPNGTAVSTLASYSGSNTAMQSLSNAVNNMTSDADKRFAPEVVSSVGQAVDQVAALLPGQKINLVGYSGGAAVAVLVAVGRKDVASIRTVAGNLDHAETNRLHGVSPLSGSLNAIDAAKEVAKIPQIHWSGAADTTVPPSIAERFREASGSPCVSARTVAGATHDEGWKERWRELLGQPPGC